MNVELFGLDGNHMVGYLFNRLVGGACVKWRTNYKKITEIMFCSGHHRDIVHKLCTKILTLEICVCILILPVI